MFFKKVSVFAFLICISTSLLAQVEINKEWQIGIGGGIVKFSKDDASFIGDQYLIQIPRLNLTVPVSNNWSVDGAISFNTIDLVISNSVKYLSLDGSARYVFSEFSEAFDPYLFAGGSIVASERKTTPTLNAGGGATYWVSNNIGLNAQVYYKHSFESYESMRSHIQVTGGLVYSFSNLFGNKKPSGSIGGACYHNQH